MPVVIYCSMRPKKVAQKPENVLLVFLHSLCPAKTTHRWFESTGTETAPVGSGSPCGPPGGRNAGTGAQSACGRIPRPAPSTDRRFIAGAPAPPQPGKCILGCQPGYFLFNWGRGRGVLPQPRQGVLPAPSLLPTWHLQTIKPALTHNNMPQICFATRGQPPRTTGLNPATFSAESG